MPSIRNPKQQPLSLGSWPTSKLIYNKMTWTHTNCNQGYVVLRVKQHCQDELEQCQHFWEGVPQCLIVLMTPVSLPPSQEQWKCEHKDKKWRFSNSLAKEKDRNEKSSSLIYCQLQESLQFWREFQFPRLSSRTLFRLGVTMKHVCVYVVCGCVHPLTRHGQGLNDFHVSISWHLIIFSSLIWHASLSYRSSVALTAFIRVDICQVEGWEDWP